METPKSSKPLRSVGAWPLTEAFGVARNLEHAGISTVITGETGLHHVLVDVEDYEQAVSRI